MECAENDIKKESSRRRTFQERKKTEEKSSPCQGLGHGHHHQKKKKKKRKERKRKRKKKRTKKKEVAKEARFVQTKKKGGMQKTPNMLALPSRSGREASQKGPATSPLHYH